VKQLLNIINRTQQLLFVVLAFYSSLISAHSDDKTINQIRYLGNEGVLIVSEKRKILIDPFFHNSYGAYTLVPENIRQSIFSGKAPYDNIDLLLISHAHGDHFDAGDAVSFLSTHKKAQIIAPQQAIDAILKIDGASNFSNRMNAVNLKLSDNEKIVQFNNITVEAIRIPHAGWPGRANIENIVYRITFKNKTTVMHFGDADPNRLHFNKHTKLWQQNTTDVALPPYWFFGSNDGNFILEQMIHSKHSIGIHVPTNVPEALKNSGKDFFSKPGEIRKIKKD